MCDIETLLFALMIVRILIFSGRVIDSVEQYSNFLFV